MSDAEPRNFLEYAQSRMVPFLDHLDITPVSAADGKASFQVKIKDIHLRTLGILHGGLTAALIDTVVGFAGMTVAPPGHHVVTMQLNMNFTRTIREGDTIIGTAEVKHRGSRTCVAYAEVHDGDGKLAATATSTIMYLPIPAEKKAEWEAAAESQS